MSKAAVIALDDIQKKTMCCALEQAGIDAVVFPSYGSALKTVNEEIKIFIIEANCYDAGAIEFIEAAAHVSAVIVVAEGMGASVLEKQLEDSGVIVLEAPVSIDVALQTIKIAGTLLSRLALLEKENKALREKLDDLKIVNRAKLCLVTRLSMSETQAHKFILRRAMDSRTSAREVSQGIIKTYEF